MLIGRQERLALDLVTCSRLFWDPCERVPGTLVRELLDGLIFITEQTSPGSFKVENPCLACLLCMKTSVSIRKARPYTTGVENPKCMCVYIYIYIDVYIYMYM